MTDGVGTHRGRVAGIDVGSVRIGLAMSDESRTIASPHATLQRRSRDLWPRLGDTLQAHHVTAAVIGLPRRLDGTEGEAAADARAFAAEVERHTGLAVTLWDERFTTALAERHLLSGGMRREHRRRTVDAVAAALLLQSWLDAQRAAAST